MKDVLGAQIDNIIDFKNKLMMKLPFSKFGHQMINKYSVSLLKTVFQILKVGKVLKKAL